MTRREAYDELRKHGFYGLQAANMLRLADEYGCCPGKRVTVVASGEDDYVLNWDERARVTEDLKS